MAAELKQKTLHYRHAKFLQSGGNLQDLLSAALAKLRKVSQRQETLSPASSLLLINHHKRALGMEFGNLLTYERGTNRLLLTLETDLDALDVAQLAPPPRLGKTTEFLDALLYYGVKNNHVLLLQSTALRSGDIEQHFNWLLKKAGVLDDDDRLDLVDFPKPEIRERAEAAAIKSVTMEAPVFDVSAPPRGPRRKTERALVVKDGIGATLLRAVVGDKEYDRLDLDAAAVDGNLKVNLEITYSRTTSENGQEALNSIARAFRNVNDIADEDLSFYIPGVGKVKGKELKLSDGITVRTNSGIVDANDLFPQMQKWLMSLIERNLVDHD